MLDAKIDSIFSIKAVENGRKDEKEGVLIVKGCEICIFGKGKIFSEFENLTFDVLNQDSGHGAMDIQITFANSITKKAYPEFYTKCFVLRTDTKKFIKPMKYSNRANCSKIDKNGDLAIGVRYYFRQEDEVNILENCNNILIEGFLALENAKNVYGYMCQMEKDDSNWKITSANTYKPKYAKNIKNLID